MPLLEAIAWPERNLNLVRTGVEKKNQRWEGCDLYRHGSQLSLNSNNNKLGRMQSIIQRVTPELSSSHSSSSKHWDDAFCPYLTLHPPGDRERERASQRVKVVFPTAQCE